MDELVFETVIIEWRGPAPFLFAPVPDEHIGAIRYAAMTESYGWGVVPVVATIGDTLFATSLFPREGGYLLPVKVAVQKSEQVGVGDRIAVRMRVGRA
ncbi:protein of unknown function [Sphingopyxis sp. YR583]|jgi:hypothetical protein|uniref:DUF1905 domain-containing protein n=1 Tax=Sphingopyxis sp. YR583 TaxID=1881047 RepID=UPI0008A72B67|nr:DUF1905 domain-containing protein [Sphingopyxis sp. YR583]SEH16765.1 protein of unknown function [Sphingopyxis sp. YR583]